MKNKKGSAVDMLLLVVIVAMVAFMLPIGYKIYNSVYEGFNDTGQFDNTSIQATGQVVEQLDNGMFDYFFLLAFVGISLVMLMLAFVTDISAPFFVLYIILFLIFVLVSIPVSNYYEELTDADAMSDVPESAFTRTNYVLQNLPMFITIIGLLVGLVMYGKYRAGSFGAI